MTNVIYYGNLHTEILCRLMTGSKDDKDIRWFKKLSQWQKSQYGDLSEDITEAI